MISSHEGLVKYLLNTQGFVKLDGMAILIFFNVYLILRERKHERGRSRETEGDTESEAGSRLRAVSTESDMGLKLINCKIMT